MQALTVLLDIYLIAHTISAPSGDPDRLFEELKLEASEELQARCSGYMEAEIERQAELLAEEAEEVESDTPASDEDEGSDTETESSQRGKKRKGKKAGGQKKGKKVVAADKRKRKTAAQIRGALSRSSCFAVKTKVTNEPFSIAADNAKERARLLATARFEQTLAPFVRAIHGGAFDLQHSVVVLKYWGRLGPVFDEQAKLLMHDLRDEGNYGSASDKVASILVDALQGACELYIDAAEETATDEHLISLGRHLQGVAAVRGAQLAIVSTLPAEDHLRVHLDALKWVVSKLARYEEAKRKADRDRTLSFFKALGHLLFGLDGRSALKVYGLATHFRVQVLTLTPDCRSQENFARRTARRAWNRGAGHVEDLGASPRLPAATDHRHGQRSLSVSVFLLICGGALLTPVSFVPQQFKRLPPQSGTRPPSPNPSPSRKARARARAKPQLCQTTRRTSSTRIKTRTTSRKKKSASLRRRSERRHRSSVRSSTVLGRRRPSADVRPTSLPTWRTTTRSMPCSATTTTTPIRAGIARRLLPTDPRSVRMRTTMRLRVRVRTTMSRRMR